MSRWRPNEPINQHICRRVRERREALCISLNALANVLDVSWQQMQKYEQGKSILSAAKLHVLAHQLGVPVAWFYEGLEKK